MISVVLLKNRLADWERLYEVRLAESDMRLWLETFRHIRADDDVLLEAFKIVQSKAVRFPKPGHLVAAIEAATEIVVRRRPPVVEPGPPHISELSAEERADISRILQETKKKLGIVEHYPELKRRTPEQVDEDARKERNRQKSAVAAVFPASPGGKPLAATEAPSSAAPPTPAPGPMPVESSEPPEPYDPSDEDIPW